MSEQAGADTRLSVKKRKKKKRKESKGLFKIQRYGGWLLYFWHGMRLRAWLALLRRGRYDITLNCLPNIATVTLWAPVNSLLYRISELVHRRKAEGLPIADEAPIFVLGHWRSGTTLLHDLLASDPRFGFATTYQCFFPNHFLLTERALAGAFRVFLPKKRPQDDVPVGMDRPQEEEFAFCNLGMGTPYITMAFPRHGPADTDYLDLKELTPAERERWVRTFLWFYRRVRLAAGKRLVLKSPAHTARVATLLTLFPNARFIHIARNPLAVVPSTMKLWRALYSTQGLHNPLNLEPWLEGYVFDVFERMAARYEADRSLIPAAQLHEIRYEDFVLDPKGMLRDIYAKLDLGDFAAAEPGVDAYLAARTAHRVATYDRAPRLAEKVTERLKPYILRFGYEEAVRQAVAIRPQRD